MTIAVVNIAGLDSSEQSVLSLEKYELFSATVKQFEFHLMLKMSTGLVL